MVSSPPETAVLIFCQRAAANLTAIKSFMNSVDTLVIGRNTFEVVLQLEEWPYPGKRVVVLSSRPIEFSKPHGHSVEQMNGAPVDIVSRLAESGVQHAYVDGGITFQKLLSAGLIDRLTIT